MTYSIGIIISILYRICYISIDFNFFIFVIGYKTRLNFFECGFIFVLDKSSKSYIVTILIMDSYLHAIKTFFNFHFDCIS